jgi:hypothetical protein
VVTWDPQDREKENIQSEPVGAVTDIAFIGRLTNREKGLLASSCLSVCLHGTAWPPLDRFS